MKSTYQHDLMVAHTFDTLSAAWVFACNDENALITFRGVRQRLNLDRSFDIEGLVRSRGDLFRQGVPASRLEAWKQEMRADKHVPNWMREIPVGDEREKVIGSLSRNDVFRSQFRAATGAPPSSLETLDWGLQHIDRLRKARYEQREKSSDTWRLGLTVAAVALPVLSGLVTLYLTQSYDLRIKGTERDITSKIEFLKLVNAQPEKEAEIVTHWKKVFPDDAWLNDFPASKK